jgi:membrane protein implicated in regulation of membrane protease activity
VVNEEDEVRLADQQMIGKVGRVTGTISPKGLGEVMVPVRGGSEAFSAYATDVTLTIERGTRIVVVEYYPPRTVVVTPM